MERYGLIKSSLSLSKRVVSLFVLQYDSSCNTQAYKLLC